MTNLSGERVWLRGCESLPMGLVLGRNAASGRWLVRFGDEELYCRAEQLEVVR